MRANRLWMFNAIKEIDFDHKRLITESFLVCRESQGGITYQDLKEMDFEQYCDTVDYADYLQPKETHEVIDG